MKAIFGAIQYFTTKKGYPVVCDNIQSFLRDRISFPKFVSLAYNINIDELLNFSPDSFPDFQKKGSNYSALGYVLQNYEIIKDNSDYFNQFRFWNSLENNLGYEKAYTIFLSLLLLVQCFHINFFSIYNKSYLITGIETFKSDLFNINFLLTLLNILTDGRVPAKVESDDLDDLDEILIQIFEEAKVPLIIDETCFKIQYKFLFLIQIQIIFETFHEKCKTLLNESEEEEEYHCDIKFALIYDKLIILNTLAEIRQKIYNTFLNINISFEFSYYKDDDKSELIQLIDQIILNTINLILENSDINFKGIFDQYNVLNLVYRLLKDDQSVHIFQRSISRKKLSLEKEILELFEFLKNKHSKFKTLLLSFEPINFAESSLINLSATILDCFFLKKSKENLYNRCYTILYGKFKKKDSNYQPYENAQGILYNFNTYVMLIHFICNKIPKIIYNISKKFKNEVLKNNNKVPIIISEDFLKLCPQEFIPNVIYYQLQFIFNSLDASDLAHHIVEYFLITIRKISQIVVPPFAKLVKSIRSKNISLILQNKRYNQNLEKKNSDNTIKQNDNQIEDNQTKHSSKHKKSKHKKSLEKNSNLDTNSSEDLVQQYEKGYFFADGILYNKYYKTDSQIFQDLMKYANEYEETENNKIPSFSNLDNTIKSDFPFYTLVSYIDGKGWCVNIHNINLINKALNNEDYKISLVFLLESNIKKATNIIKIINNQISKEISVNENNISVLYFFDKNISDFIIGDNSGIPQTDKKTIPLYMFLNVPKDKQNLPNITEIVFQIYFFISLISDINIVILDREKCNEQIKVINDIVKLKKSNINYANDTQDKDKIDFILSNDKINFLILVNDDSICYHKANKDIENTSLFKDMLCKICFINIDNQNSYGDFINNFIKLAIGSNNNHDDILKKFSLIKNFEMNYNNNNYNCILDDLEAIAKKELKKRSSKNLKHLSHVLKSRLYWPNEQLDNIKFGHVDFVKDEFFNITQELCSEDDAIFFYETKRSILQSRIDKDTIKIDKLFQEVEKQREICQTTLEIDVEKGTNYTIREKENEREIKARIESTGKLEDLIEQDF